MGWTGWGEQHPELFWTLFIVWLGLTLYALAWVAEAIERRFKR